MALLYEFKDRLKEGKDNHGTFRTDSLRAFRLYGNDHWDQKDKDHLEGQQRPAVTFNKTTPIINAVSGSEITNRFETRFFPRTADDEMFAEIVTETLRYIRQRADIEHEESGAFRDAVICGMGATEFRKDYTEDAEGTDRVDRVPIFELLWSSAARRSNLSDNRWIIRGKWVDTDEAVSRWPEHKEVLIMKSNKGGGEKSVFGDQVGTTPHDQTRAHEYSQDSIPPAMQAGKVLIHEYHRWVLEPYVLFENPISGEDEEISQENWARVKTDLETQGLAVSYTDLSRKVYHTAYFCEDFELQDDVALMQSGFKYKFITGLPFQKEDRVEWFGLMKLMEEPQMWTNKMMSQIIHIVSTNPKGAIIAEENVFKDETQAREEWGKPSPLLIVNPGMGDKYKTVDGKYPQAQDRIMQISMAAVPEAVGVNPYFMGQVDDLKRTASSAVTSVQQQAMVVLSVLFDSLRRYRKEAGRMHLEFMQKLMPDGAIVRVVMPGAVSGKPVPVEFKSEWVDKVKYDIIVDEAPTSMNAIRDTWQTLNQTNSLEMLVQMGLLTPDVIAEMIPDVPVTVREKMKQNAFKQDAIGQVMQALQSGDEAGALQMMYQMMGASPEGQQPQGGDNAG